MFSEAEVSALAARGFSRAYFSELYCRECGFIRIAQALPPENGSAICPLCGQVRASSPMLCEGFTRLALPLFEIMEAAATEWPVRALGDAEPRGRLIMPGHKKAPAL